MFPVLLFLVALVFVGLGVLGVASMGIGGISFFAMALVLVILGATAGFKRRGRMIQTSEA
jgi:hypothetical protein